MADYTPVFPLGAAPFTMTTSAIVTGGNLVESTGTGTVAHAGALSAKVIGIAGHDAASGAKLTVWPLNCVHETVTAAGVTAGNHLKAVAAGAGVDPTPASYDVDVGVALTTATAGLVTRWMGH